MAELADFCLDERRGPYVWWQAAPWAGKSALLAWTTWWNTAHRPKDP
ncbi:hypothetical protein ACIPSE_39625 [Streptomyces sp. NPDC090106]